jgi:hypothetical protein
MSGRAGQITSDIGWDRDNRLRSWLVTRVPMIRAGTGMRSLSFRDTWPRLSVR